MTIFKGPSQNQPVEQFLTRDALGNPVLNTLVTDGDGFFFYAAPGTYIVLEYIDRHLYVNLPDQTLF